MIQQHAPAADGEPATAATNQPSERRRGVTRGVLRALVVEDSEDDAVLLLLELRRGGYDVDHRQVMTRVDMEAALADQAWDVVFSDYSMPAFSGPAALATLRATGLDVPFIMVSGTIGEDTAVDALKAGANDFLVKGRLARLVPAVERELREAARRRRQREAETALRTSEARFRAIMDASSDGVVATDDRGRLTYANRAAHEMFGYALGEILVLGLGDLVVARAGQPSVADLLRTMAGGGAGRAVEAIGRRRDGTELPVDLSLGTWEADGVRQFAGIVRDITDRKKVEAQLMVADRMVSVGTLAAGVAHEINNPLAALMANLELAQMQAPLLRRDAGGADAAPVLEQVIDELRDAAEAADRVRLIVRDLKIFSRGEDEQRGPVDVRRVMESSIRMAWNELRHRARVVRDYGDVPPVDGSDARLGQVFLNLVVNAAQAMTDGHADEHQIRVTTRSRGTLVLIEIADTGPGIPPEVMRRLFTPFVTTKPVGVGTGLGLPICHRIVTGFGGEIAVETRLGEGTTFRITLPAAVGAVVPSSRDIPAIREAPRRGRVLVVDDEPMIARSIQRMLARDHDVVAVQRASDAIELIGSGERFDVILCDLMMPEMGGMDLHETLTRIAPAQAEAMVFVTGGAFTSRSRQFLDEVPNPHVDKPFDVARLKNLIAERVR